MSIIILIYHTTKSMGTPFHSPGIWLEDSFLAKCSSATSFCTGCATAEISRAILERDVNSSGKASFHMSIPTIACWATCLASHNLLTPTGVVQLINFIWMGYCKWNINIFMLWSIRPIRSMTALVNVLSRNPLSGLSPLLRIHTHLASLATFWGWCPSMRLMPLMGTMASSKVSWIAIYRSYSIVINTILHVLPTSGQSLMWLVCHVQICQGQIING